MGGFGKGAETSGGANISYNNYNFFQTRIVKFCIFSIKCVNKIVMDNTKYE